MGDGALVMQGTFGGGTSLDEVLSVLAISRQWMELVLHDDARPQGSILCKSGQVLTAFALPDRNGVDAFVALYRRPPRGFSVYQRPRPAHVARPLGALADLIAHAQAATPPPTAPDVVLEGTFDDFGIREVLDVLSLGRQVMELVTARADGSRIVLATKAGRVLSCEEPERGRSGLDAFHSLLRDPGRRFRVVRRAGVAFRGEALGPLGELLAQAAQPAAEPPPAVLLEGDFASSPIQEVLDVVGLTRQLVEIVFRDEAGTRGAILVKAGRVLEARSARSGASGRDAVVELVRDPGRSFVVVRRAQVVAGREPVGTLAELAAAARAAPERTVLLEGDLQRTPLAEVLDVVGLTRQHVELVLLAGGAPVGRLRAKAGRLLSASGRGREGTAAVDALLSQPGDAFRVEHLRGIAPGEPLGALGDVVARLRSRAPSVPAAPVLQGRFGDTRIGDLLESVGLSRQLMEIRVARDQKALGRILLKSGQLLDVQHGDLRGEAAFRAILADPGTQYRVARHADDVHGEPLGTIADWLAAAAAPAREVVLEGTFADASVVEVLGTVSLSRQHLAVDFEGRGEPRARLVLKAGRVLEAQHGAKTGAAAVQALLADPGDRFVVYRMPPGARLPEPIGRLQDLLATAAPAPPSDFEDDAPPTVVLSAPRGRPSAPPPSPANAADEAPTMVAAPVDPTVLRPEPPAEVVLARLRERVEALDPGALEARLRELATAIANLERALSSPPMAERGSDRAWLAAVAGLQVITLLLAGALLARLWLGG